MNNLNTDKNNYNVKDNETIDEFWNNDYIIDNDLKLRSSVGLSMDILTPIAPISFSYAIPIKKEQSDKIRQFNFSLGTSF